MDPNDQELIRYIILGLARSGTTAVHFALKGHPNVSALNDEVNLSFFTEGISSFTQRDDNQKEKNAGYHKLFDALAGVFQDESTMALGMKCVPNSVEAANELVDSLRQHFPELKVVLVNREDLVAQYGSYLRAKSTGEWHSWRKSGDIKDFTVKIRTSRFRAYVTKCKDIYQVLKSLDDSHQVLEFSYEQCFLQGGEPDFSQLFGFIGVPQIEAAWLGSEKVAPPPDLYIKNYAELKKIMPGLHADFVKT